VSHLITRSLTAVGQLPLFIITGRGGCPSPAAPNNSWRFPEYSSPVSFTPLEFADVRLRQNRNVRKSLSRVGDHGPSTHDRASVHRFILERLRCSPPSQELLVAMTTDSSKDSWLSLAEIPCSKPLALAVEPHSAQSSQNTSRLSNKGLKPALRSFLNLGKRSLFVSLIAKSISSQLLSHGKGTPYKCPLTGTYD